MTEGYKALTKGAAAIDLSARTRLRVTGEDRARLLHALTTNHVQQLLPGHGCYSFFLNANGRILADANLFVFPEHILIDAEPEVRESLFAHLDHYIIADDVTPHDEGDITFALGVEGPEASERLCAVGAPVPPNDYAHEQWNDCTVAKATYTGAPGWRVFGPANRKDAVRELLYLVEATAKDAETVRIEHRRPRYGTDITASQIAAETGLTEALHFQKGCYLGQEIVERVRSRGHLNKRLVAFELDGKHVPDAHARVTADGKEAGEITSAAYSPERGVVVALGYIRMPHDAAGTAVTVEEQSGRVR